MDALTSVRNAYSGNVTLPLLGTAPMNFAQLTMGYTSASASVTVVQMSGSVTDANRYSGGKSKTSDDTMLSQPAAHSLFASDDYPFNGGTLTVGVVYDRGTVPLGREPLPATVSPSKAARSSRRGTAASSITQGHNANFSAPPKDGFDTSGALTKLGADILIPMWANTRCGGTNINASTLQMASGATLVASGNVMVSAGAFFDLNGTSQSITGLAGARQAKNSVTGTGMLTTDSGQSDGVTGNVALTKTSGTPTLDGGSVPTTGPTTVGASTLAVNNGGELYRRP